MIKLRIKNGEHETDVRFPITEKSLLEKLSEINCGESRFASQSVFVSAVHHPKELSVLNGRYADLDELNYLAKRMESFDSLEYDQFIIGISKLKAPTEKNLINLTFNLDHFTLCRDVSSFGRIGRAYVLNIGIQDNTGIARTVEQEGQESVPTAHGAASKRSQGKVVRGSRVEHRRAEHGLGYVHGTFKAQCLSRFGA